MSYPRFQRSRSLKLIKRATGTDLSLNATAITELAAATNGPGTGGFDLALEAQTGDVLEWGFNAQWGNQNVVTALDVYTMVSGTRTNPFGAGLSASVASTAGVMGWQAAQAAFAPLVGSALYVVQAGDVSSGVVTCRPYFAQASATAKTLFSSANFPLQMWFRNLGPVSV